MNKLYILLAICLVSVQAIPTRRYDVKSRDFEDAMTRQVENFRMSINTNNNKRTGIQTPVVISDADMDVINNFENQYNDVKRKFSPGHKKQ